MVLQYTFSKEDVLCTVRWQDSKRFLKEGGAFEEGVVVSCQAFFKRGFGWNGRGIAAGSRFTTCSSEMADDKESLRRQVLETQLWWFACVQQRSWTVSAVGNE